MINPDPQIEQLIQTLADGVRVSLMDAMFRVEAFKAAFETNCPCGEPAVLCSVHADGATFELEREMFL